MIIRLTSSAASLAALKRLDRCWFILALGATPSAQNKCQQIKKTEDTHIYKIHLLFKGDKPGKALSFTE